MKKISSYPKLKYWAIFLIFFLLVCFVRSSSFFKSVIDWDESVYLVMADHLLQGDIPYTKIWDNKPPGIYFLFALCQLVFGKTILAIRILACLAVTFSSFLLYKTVGNFSSNSTLYSWAAGLLYLSASLNNGGIAANTEIFFTPFIIYAIYILSKQIRQNISQQKGIQFVLVGILLGISLQIKYVVIFDYFAVLIIIGIILYQEKKSNIYLFLKQFCITGGYLTIGLLIPTFMVIIFFWGNGYFNEYFSANFIANFINTTNTELSIKWFIRSFYYQFFTNFFLWISFVLSLFYLKRGGKSNILLYLYIWLVCVFCGLFFTKNFWDHYYLQLLPVLCLIAVYVISKIFQELDGTLSKKTKLMIMVVIFSSPLFYSSFSEVREAVKIVYFNYVKENRYMIDTPREIADYLKSRISENDYLYIADYQPILYYLLDARIPTKYIFPPIIYDEHFSKMAGIDGVKELKYIISKKPLYITLCKCLINDFYAQLDDSISNEYKLEKTIAGVEIYRRK